MNMDYLSRVVNNRTGECELYQTGGYFGSVSLRFTSPASAFDRGVSSARVLPHHLAPAPRSAMPCVTMRTGRCERNRPGISGGGATALSAVKDPAGRVKLKQPHSPPGY